MIFLRKVSNFWSSFKIISLISIIFFITQVKTTVIRHIDYYNEIQPEFVEPIKNMTSPIGTNVDFTCTVRHLGSSRMMWFKRQPDKKEELLGVNGLKITKNHKISLSVIPSSGIVTQSILYIYNIEKEDVGEYICGINTNPVITQSGSLEIKPEDHTTTEQNHKKATKTTLPPNNNLSNDQQDFTVTTIIIDNNQKSSSNSTEGIFCIDFPKLWKDSKQEAQKFFYSIWDKLHRYF